MSKIINSKMFNISEETNLFITTAYSMFRSSGDISLERLVESYKRMSPVIHSLLNEEQVDTSVLVYSTLRLPSCIISIQKILLGQSEGIFEENKYKVQEWEEVVANARRRRYLYDGDSSLAAFIASKSDLDDLIPTLIAYQIEWNKVHHLLQNVEISDLLNIQSPGSKNIVCEALGIEEKDLSKLDQIWGDEFFQRFITMKSRKCDFRIQNLEASYSRYRKETNRWWSSIKAKFPDIDERPVYFVSSNTHSLINVISGFAYKYKHEIISYARSESSLKNYVDLWDLACEKNDEREQNNILYYLLKKYQQSGTVQDIDQLQQNHEENVGIYRLYDKTTLDIPTQVIDMQYLDGNFLDSSINRTNISFLKRTKALIINIDYPLGRAAYYVLSKIAEHTLDVLGTYIIGKAASLTADCGDVLLPTSVYDQHTLNTFQFDNCIKADSLKKLIKPGSCEVYDNQKAVTVLGTFIQSKKDINNLFQNGLTDIEMESGPYLSAIYEMIKPKRYPEGESISISNTQMDLGIVHYVSDNPLRGKKLGDENLSYKGIEATYAATISVVDRIFNLEKERSLGE